MNKGLNAGMNTGASEPAVIVAVARAASRIGQRTALRAAAIAIGASATLLLVSRAVRTTDSSTVLNILLMFALATIGASIGWWQSRAARAKAAELLDARVPASRNLLVTAHELLRGTSAPGGEVPALVLARADTVARAINVNSVFPLRDAWKWCAVSVVAWAVCLAFVQSSVPAIAARTVRTVAASAAGRVAITGLSASITPPRYTQRAAITLREPSRVEALRGSGIAFTLSAVADTVLAISRDSTGEHVQSLVRSGANAFALTVNASTDSYLAFEPRSNDGRVGERRLVVITARADESPRVRILAPAKDLVVPDAKQTLDIKFEADDDLALSTLKLKYTKVSGAGERFTFSEGEVPVALTKASPSEWSARAQLALAPLLTEEGDLVVYRAVATDNRPGAEPVESDSYIAELAAKGGVAALGFSVDPDEDRYALSQQMVILKTERLIAKKSTLAPQALADSAMQIATEQRRVRAEFVFMMGGEFAQETTGDVGEELDETAETESEADLAAGRMVNRGRTALLNAVRNMSRAAVSLTTSDLTPALASEKRALTQLQDAFARARFLMKALSQREQLDLTRRQTGKLDSIARGTLPVPDGERDVKAAAWRGILADLLSSRTSVNYTTLAERALQIDASSAAAQRIASWLLAAPNKPAARDSAAIAMTTLLRDATRPAPVSRPTLDERLLRDALTASPRVAVPRAPLQRSRP